MEKDFLETIRKLNNLLKEKDNNIINLLEINKEHLILNGELRKENKELKNDNAVMRAGLIKMCDSEKRELQQENTELKEEINKLKGDK